MTNGEFTRVRLRTVTFALLAAAAVLVGTAGPAAASNDPGFPSQWNMRQIGAPAAWARSTGRNVTIGIVDTGVESNHQDLAGKVVASASCVGGCGSASAQDDNGHGTHVSGIATAIKDNNVGIAGVAPEARLVVAKVLDKDGSGSVDDVNAGIHWVVDHGAKVVNLSLGSDVSILTGLFGDSSLSDGIEYAWSKGAVAVLAAGNSNLLGLGSSNYGNTDALVVGATGPSGDVTGYSSPIGTAKWGLVAPGGDDANDAECRDAQQQGNCVLSTWVNNQYAWAQGTSMATPHVTGAVALLLAEGLNRDAAVNRILGTLAPVPGCGKNTCGGGRLDVAAAVGLPPTPPTSGSGSPGATGSGGGKNVDLKPSPSRGTVAPKPSGATTTAAPEGSTTTAAPAAAAEIPPGDNPVVAAGRMPGQVQKNGGRPSSSRALQVGAAIALLGGAGTGLGLLLRLRGGAAP